MEENIELKLIGITYNQIDSGVYALVLEDPIERRRLAIVIGYPEAQSIECKLQNVKTPRPLSHDLLAKLLEVLNGKLMRVDIHKLPSGPYAGKLTIKNAWGEKIEIDARSSDAISLAIRVGAPIYTNKKLLEKEGYMPGSSSLISSGSAEEKTKEKRRGLKTYEKIESEASLHELLAKCVSDENYEEAAEIKKEIERRKNKKERDL